MFKSSHQLLTRSQVARHTGLPVATIDRLTAEGKLPVAVDDGIRRYDLAVVDQCCTGQPNQNEARLADAARAEAGKLPPLTDEQLDRICADLWGVR